MHPIFKTHLSGFENIYMKYVNTHVYDKGNILMYTHLSCFFCLVENTIVCTHSSANASVIISPCTDYTTFENNASTFTFNCSGGETFLYWTVDGHDNSTPYVLNKGISYTSPVSPDGLTVSSQLIVPTTKANNNITVMCTVLDTSFKYFQSSDPVRLILQGTCMCYEHAWPFKCLECMYMYCQPWHCIRFNVCPRKTNLH